MTTVLLLAVVFALILVNGFFALAEMAVVASSRSRLEKQARQGARGAQAALRLKADSGRFLSSIQTGITLVGVVASVFSGATIAADLGTRLDAVGWIAPHGETAAFIVIVAAITFVTVVIGELVPKRIALANPEPMAKVVAPTVEMVAVVLCPLVALLAFSSKQVLRVLRIKEKRRGGATEADLLHLLAEATRTKAIDPVEKAMVQRVVRLADRSVRTIMTPRMEIDWVDLDAPIDSAAAQIAEAPHSRLVAARGEVDRAEGVIHARDCIPLWLRGEKPDLTSLVRPAVMLPDTASIVALLEAFQKSPTHLAFVIDENGGLQGIVTPTDILEAVAGSLAEERQPAEALVRPYGEGYVVDGRTPVDELRTEFGVDFGAGEDVQTVAGLVMDCLGRLPKEGESVAINDWRFEVIDMDDRRIDKLFVTHDPATNGSRDQTEDS